MKNCFKEHRVSICCCFYYYFHEVISCSILYLFLIPHEINTCVKALYIPFLAFGLRRIGLFYKKFEDTSDSEKALFLRNEKRSCD